MRINIVSVAAAALVVMASGAKATDAGDKQTPCAQAAAVSDSEIDIKDLARICTGEVELLYHQDGYSGRAFASMVSGASRSNRGSADVTAAISHLQELADTDSSGEVSADESRVLADLVMLGILEAQMASTYGSDRAAVLAATVLNEAELAAKESAYRTLASRAQELGFMLPGGLQVGR